MMNWLLRSMAYQPPPTLLKLGPKLFGVPVARTPQPLLPWQSKLPAVPVMGWRLAGMVQPGLVCRVIWFMDWSLTPSTCREHVTTRFTMG